MVGFFGFSTIFREILVLVAFCSVLSAGLARTKFAAKTRRAKTPLFAHTRTSNHPHFTRQHYTPLSHPTTPYQLRPAPTSRTLHPTHTLDENFLHLCFPNIPLRICVDTREGVCLTGVGIPNLGALPIIASFSLTHLPCLFACFYEPVSCVYAFFSTCLASCVASAEWFVFGFVFITTFLFSCFFSCDYSTYLWHGVLLYAWPSSYVCPPFLSTCLLFEFLRMCIWTSICISLLFHIRTHLSPFSCVLFVLCSILTPMFVCFSSFSETE